MTDKLTSGKLAERYGVTLQTILRWRRLGWVTGARYPGSRAFYYDPGVTDGELEARGIQLPPSAVGAR